MSYHQGLAYREALPASAGLEGGSLCSVPKAMVAEGETAKAKAKAEVVAAVAAVAVVAAEEAAEAAEAVVVAKTELVVGTAGTAGMGRTRVATEVVAGRVAARPED